MKKVLVILLLIAMLPVLAAQEDLVLRSEVDRAKATTGDLITFTVSIDSIEGLKVQLPEFGEKIEGFRVVDFGSSDPVVEDGRVNYRRWYKLRADIVGTYILPAIELVYDDKAGKEQTAKTSEIFIEVASVLKEGDEQGDIRDLKDLSSSPRRLTTLSIVLIAVMVVAIVFVVFLYRRKRKGKEIALPVIPPHEVALQRLNALKSEELLQNNQQKRFHFALSEIIRNYFEGMFELTTTDMTIEEIRSRMSDVKSLDDDLKKLFLSMLTRTDIVKFTDTISSEEEGELLLGDAFEFVDKTKPEVVVEQEDSVI